MVQQIKNRHYGRLMGLMIHSGIDRRISSAISAGVPSTLIPLIIAFILLPYLNTFMVASSEQDSNLHCLRHCSMKRRDFIHSLAIPIQPLTTSFDNVRQDLNLRSSRMTCGSIPTSPYLSVIFRHLHCHKSTQVVNVPVTWS